MGFMVLAEEGNEEARDVILAKATEYCDRATILKRLLPNARDLSAPASKMNHINYLFDRGLEYDEKEKWNEAFTAYVAGCELALRLLDSNPPNKEYISEKINLILGRIEEVKEFMKGLERQTSAKINDAGAPELSDSEIQRGRFRVLLDLGSLFGS
ncbi:hypothetical protein BDR26DRAFT_25559 [Obelidium mucronatum]|nr:hypothetical protein BDR26DRAFT_25559 [Obelidium mucronatum]